MKSDIMKSCAILMVFTLLCGLGYTAVVTGAAGLFFPSQAAGSLIEVEGETRGSSLLSQPFSEEAFLWGRPTVVDANAFIGKDGEPLLYAGPSNQSPAGIEYGEEIAERVSRIRAAHPEMGDTKIPVELVTGSGSGLDPDISMAAAKYQAKRIARNNDIPESTVLEIFEQCKTKRFLSVFGEETVNVLKVNLALYGMLP